MEANTYFIVRGHTLITYVVFHCFATPPLPKYLSQLHTVINNEYFCKISYHNIIMFYGLPIRFSKDIQNLSFIDIDKN